MNFLGKNGFKLIVATFISGFAHKMYTWEKFLYSWTSVVFSDGRVFGAIRLGMLLDSKKGDRASLLVAPSV